MGLVIYGPGLCGVWFQVVCILPTQWSGYLSARPMWGLVPGCVPPSSFSTLASLAGPVPGQGGGLANPDPKKKISMSQLIFLVSNPNG